MKRIIALFLTIIILTTAVCACNKQNTDEIQTNNTKKESTITTSYTNESLQTQTKVVISTETTSTDKIKTNEEFHYVKTGYHINSIFEEMPSRILVADGQLQYYSKVDGEIYIFCFDPLCDHNGEYCTSLKFRSNANAVYSPFSNRLYLTRRQNLFSMNFDGTDIKLEVSFGDIGKDLNIPTKNSNENIICLKTYNEYLYFIYPTKIENVESENGSTRLKATNSLFRYNLETKKLENLSESVGYEGNYFNEYYIIGNKIFFNDYSTEFGYRFCYTNLDMTDLLVFDLVNDSPLIISNAICYDEQIYTTVEETKDKKTTKYIICIDTKKKETVLLTDKYEMLINNGASSGKGDVALLAVTDDYIYYTINDPFLLGIAHTKSGDRYVCTSNHTTYRMNKDGSNNIVVFEGVTSNDPSVMSFAIDNMYIIGNKVIAKIWANQYTGPQVMPSGGINYNWQHTKFVTFDIAPDGSFVNMHELELDE